MQVAKKLNQDAEALGGRVFTADMVSGLLSRNPVLKDKYNTASEERRHTSLVSAHKDAKAAPTPKFAPRRSSSQSWPKPPR